MHPQNSAFLPASHSTALAEDETISRMARALRPFRNIDIAGVAKLALIRGGFAPRDVNALWRKAATAELARRRAYPGRAA